MSHTFMFADLAGFTALTEAHGDRAAADLAQSFCELAREELGPYDAEEVKTLGDAILLRAGKPAEGVELGLRISVRVAATPGFPVLRVGMHTGSAVERDGDWFGSTVNLAARVAAAAGGDEVLLTESTREGAGEMPGVELEALGRHSFRNVAERIPLYRALPSRAQTPSTVDPVCRMSVDPARSAGHLKHGTANFHFCSLECARQFAADPDVYVNANNVNE